MHTLQIIVCYQGAVLRSFVFNDLSGLCSVAHALCGPARQLSSPALPAASAGWPELQQQLPEKGGNASLNHHIRCTENYLSHCQEIQISCK